MYSLLAQLVLAQTDDVCNMAFFKARWPEFCEITTLCVCTNDNALSLVGVVSVLAM